MPTFEYSLPAVRATQAGRDFFVSMCPGGMLSTLFREEVSGTRPDIQSKQILNKDRVPEIVGYILGHRNSYVFSAITAIVDSTVRFDPHGNGDHPAASGSLSIPLSARLILLDGLHRVAALQESIHRDPKLANEAVPLVIFVDPDFKHINRFFTDLKCNERKVSSSLRVFHADHDQIAMLTRELTTRVPIFVDMIEMSRSTISNRSRKLFTLSALYQANRTLLADLRKADYEENLDAASDFWNEVAAQFPDWAKAKAGQVSPAELRKSSVQVHGIALSAIARAGRTLLARNPKSWRKKLRRLKSLDWSRSNTSLWEGRAMIGGRLSKSNSCVALTGNAVKKHLGLVLTDDEAELERQFQSGR